MTTIVITAGGRYTDIDALACAYALQEAMHHAGQTAMAVLPGPPNATVPEEYHHEPLFRPEPDAAFDGIILVDMSDPAHIPPFGHVDQVVGIFDHHFGHEEFWLNRLGPDKSVIRPIGAAATLVWNHITNMGVADQLSPAACELIATAIVSNTCDLKLDICTAEDHAALKACVAHAGLHPTWKHDYFADVDAAIVSDLQGALRRDTKTVQTQKFGTLQVGQIELNAKDRDEINVRALASEASDIDVTLLSLHKPQQTLCVTHDREIARAVSRDWETSVQTDGTTFVVESDRLRLRKMILPALSQ